MLAKHIIVVSCYMSDKTAVILGLSHSAVATAEHVGT